MSQKEKRLGHEVRRLGSPPAEEKRLGRPPAEEKRLGRPPAGLGKHGEPERIRDYPKLLITIRPTVKAKLKAIAEHQDRPAWKVVEDAIDLYAARLPLRERLIVEKATLSLLRKPPLA